MGAFPGVSIITPTYNHERYIIDCLESAVSQTYKDWEMIVIDDGSSDSTGEIVKEYGKRDKRIKLFTQDNIGIFRLAETYNYALKQASGKYIAILEGDDIWEPFKLEKQVTALESNNDLVLAWGSVSMMNENLTEVMRESPDHGDKDRKYFANDPLGSILNILFFRNCIPALTILVRKSALDAIGGFHQGYGLPLVDLPTLQLLATRGYFHFDPQILGSWRIYANQATKTYVVQITKGFYELALNINQALKQNKGLQFSVDTRAIKSYFKKQLVISYARSGRYRLIRKEFSGARKDYCRALFSYGFRAPVWKIRAMIGLIFSFFNMDIEGFAKLVGRKSYR